MCSGRACSLGISNELSEDQAQVSLEEGILICIESGGLTGKGRTKPWKTPITIRKKMAVINDISGFGRCSITVAMPIISVMGIQCCPVPTSIFSNHTAYPDYFFDDYTDKMPAYISKWKKLGLEFEGIYSGFLGSGEQIDIVRKFIQDFRTDRTRVIVDPVMGDWGAALRHLYR